jgi:hypothetical protein
MLVCVTKGVANSKWLCSKKIVNDGNRAILEMTGVEYGPPMWLGWVTVVGLSNLHGLHHLVLNVNVGIVRQVDYERLLVRSDRNELR